MVWTPLKNISQLGWLFPIYGKIKNGNQTTNQHAISMLAMIHWIVVFFPIYPYLSHFKHSVPSSPGISPVIWWSAPWGLGVPAPETKAPSKVSECSQHMARLALPSWRWRPVWLMLSSVGYSWLDHRNVHSTCLASVKLKWLSLGLIFFLDFEWFRTSLCLAWTQMGDFHQYDQEVVFSVQFSSGGNLLPPNPAVMLSGVDLKRMSSHTL